VPKNVEDKDIYDAFCYLTNSGELDRRAALNETAKKFGLSTKSVYSAVERLKNSRPS
jgi:hypothetical protein